MIGISRECCSGKYHNILAFELTYLLGSRMGSSVYCVALHIFEGLCTNIEGRESSIK